MHDPQADDYWAKAPADDFQMGLSDEEAKAFVLGNAGVGLTPERLSDEQPGHPVHVDGFFIAKTPLVNLIWQRFVDAGGYGRADLFVELREDRGPEAAEALASFIDAAGKPGPSTWADGRFAAGTENCPVDGVCFYEAAAAARFFGGRLPSEREWEYAARYPDGRLFVWGDGIPEKQLANFKWNREDGPSPVGKYEAGKSALGLHDLAGNVHEWTTTVYGAYPRGKVRTYFAPGKKSRVVRGGAYNGDIWDLRTTSRFAVDPLLRFSGLGVRLLRA